MSLEQTLITMGLVLLGTMLTRGLVFVLFPEGRELPRYVAYLAKVLPAAVLGMLVIYCYQDATPLVYPYALPELLAGLAVVLLHLKWHKMLLSLVAGTGLYMLLLYLF